MKANQLNKVPAHFEHYVSLVSQDRDLLDVFSEEGLLCWRHSSVSLTKLENKVYAPGKWTAPQLFNHVVDTERVLGFRILGALRGDKSVYPSFDEESYAANCKAANRNINSLIAEHELVRNTNLNMLRYASDKEMKQTININGNDLSAEVMAFIIMGHSLHHFNIIKERYFTIKSEKSDDI